MPLLPRSDRPESRWGGPWLALAGLLSLAAALRLVGVGYGLPFAFLSPDERNIVPRAWAIANGGGLDPEWFDYPSLVLYLLAPFQAAAEEPSYLSGRLVVVAIGVAGVAAAWWLGRRAYGAVAGGVAAAVTAVETTHVAYSRMAVTDVPLTTGATVSLALLVGGQLELAGLAAGLAAAAKYPGILLLVPIAIVGWRRWSRLAGAGLAALGGFLAATPFVAAHPGQAWEDASRVQRLARAGWLGFEGDSISPVAFVQALWEGMGPVFLVAVAGLVAALAVRRRADVALASFVLLYFATLLPLDAHFDRYVLPLVPALGALAGRIRALAPVTLLLLVVPLVWSVRETRDLTRPDTREAAHAWLEEHVPVGARVAVDPSTPPVARANVLHLALPGPGRPTDLRRDIAELRGRGVDYVVVTGDVTDRVLAARGRYPLEARFYEDLREETRRVYHLEPGDRYSGPWVAVYRLERSPTLRRA